MLCPACGDMEMFVLEFQQVEIDYCPQCAGVWLDSGELELIGERAGALRGELLAAIDREEGVRPAAATQRRRCPVCRKVLREVTTRTDTPIVLDRCPAEHGLWFDRHELGALVQTAGADRDNVLARFFAELGGQGAAAVEGGA